MAGFGPPWKAERIEAAVTTFRIGSLPAPLVAASARQGKPKLRIQSGFDWLTIVCRSANGCAIGG